MKLPEPKIVKSLEEIQKRKNLFSLVDEQLNSVLEIENAEELEHQIKQFRPPSMSIIDQVLPCIELPTVQIPLNTMRIINSKMSTGKTWSIPNVFCEKLAKRGVKLIIVAFPLNEIPDISEFEKAQDRMSEELGFNFKIVDAVGESKDSLDRLWDRIDEEGEPVQPTIILTTNQYLYVNNKEKFAEYINKVGPKKCAIFQDEAHSWMTSCSDNYENDKGVKIGFYAASGYVFLEKFAQESPYVFGITATPTAELKHQAEDFKLHEDYVELNPAGTMKFEVITESQAKNELTGFVAPYKKLGLFDVSNQEEVEDLIEAQLEEILYQWQTTGIKKTMIIWGTNDSSHEPTPQSWRTDRIIQTIQKILRKNSGKPHWPKEGVGAIVEMTHKGNFLYSRSNENHIARYQSSAQAKSAISKTPKGTGVAESPFILLVKQKAKVGMSINNISTGIMLRSSERKFKNPLKAGVTYVTGVSIQQIGRLMRLNLPEAVKEFNKEHKTFGFLNYFTQPGLSYSDKGSLIDSISFKFFAPNIPMWVQAFEELKSEYNSVEEDQENLRILESQIISTASVGSCATEEGELVCPECGYVFGE